MIVLVRISGERALDDDVGAGHRTQVGLTHLGVDLDAIHQASAEDDSFGFTDSSLSSNFYVMLGTSKSLPPNYSVTGRG